jgi:hypothetical protein
MAKQVLKDAFIKIDGVTLSDNVSSVTLEDSADEVEFTGFGADYREYGQGLKTASITLEVFQDFAPGDVDSVLQPLYASGGTFSVEVRPTSSTVSATNPKYTMTGRLFSYSPLQGAVGDANTTSVTINNAGTAGLVRGTTA